MSEWDLCFNVYGNLKWWCQLNCQPWCISLTIMLLVANMVITKWCKKPENDWNPGKWVLIWEYSTRAIQWIPIWQGLDGFLKSSRPCTLTKVPLALEGWQFLLLYCFKWLLVRWSRVSELVRPMIYHTCKIKQPKLQPHLTWTGPPNEIGNI